MTQTPSLGSGLLAKASFVPSGDHAGCASNHEPLVSCRTLSPLAVIVKIWAYPLSRVDTNAILVPSGDHAGCPSNAVSAVRDVVPVPSAFMITTSKLMLSGLVPRSDSNAMRSPSGDHEGQSSWPNDVVSCWTDCAESMT